MSLHSANPTYVLKQIQKKKYRAAILPISLVFLSFILNSYYEIGFAKYFSLLGLLGYIVILRIYRIQLSRPDVDDNQIYAPINGKIIAVEENKIKIKKSIFDSSEIRLGSKDPLYLVGSLKGKYLQFSDVSPKQGDLIGIAPGNVIIEITIPKGFISSIEIAAKVEAGESILASKMVI